MDNKFVSRFIQECDEKIEEVVLKLPEIWWSRPYEYAWASQFASSDDIVLDAACGVGHPFKFLLTDLCKEVHACDSDERVLSTIEMIRDLIWNFGAEAGRFPLAYFNRVHLVQSDITNTPYENKQFDKVFCISVLEHLPIDDVKKALQEFKRILKDDGRIVLTIDYPYFDISLLEPILESVGLTFVGPVDFALPANALMTNRFIEFKNGLYSFRAILKKMARHANNPSLLQ